MFTLISGYIWVMLSIVSLPTLIESRFVVVVFGVFVYMAGLAGLLGRQTGQTLYWPCTPPGLERRHLARLREDHNEYHSRLDTGISQVMWYGTMVCSLSAEVYTILRGYKQDQVRGEGQVSRSGVTNSESR